MPRSIFYYQQVKRDYTQAKEAILSLYHESKQRDGYRPFTLKLRQVGLGLNHKTVLKLMHELRICSILRKKRNGKRGKKSHIAPNMLNRDFRATRLNQNCPIIHSDQGVLYGTAEWVKMLEGKAVQSMSRRGNCYDNAVIESFFAILKSECFYSRTYTSIAELQAEIEAYLVYYNQKRIKLDLKGLSPAQYRAQYLRE